VSTSKLIDEENGWKRVRLIAYKPKAWQREPNPYNDVDESQVWILVGCTLAWLTCDPGEMVWKEHGTDKIRQFFQYSAKLGRSNFDEQDARTPLTMKLRATTI
jgi:hypothetical protein